MSRMILSSFVTFIAATAIVSVAGANYNAVVYEQGSNKQKELFKQSVEIKTVDGKDQIKSVYTDTAGNVAIEQNVVLEGSKVIRDEVQQKQTNEVGIIEVRDGKIHFTKTSGGKTKTDDEKLGSTFVVSASFQRFVKDNWADVSGGKTVAFRYGVWDRMETVGFEITKMGTETVGGEEAVVLKMKPSSFVIAAIVKPITFKFKADGSRLLEMNGRAAPKMKDGNKFKDLDAEIVYTYL